jgi:hypothetical protein
MPGKPLHEAVALQNARMADPAVQANDKPAIVDVHAGFGDSVGRCLENQSLFLPCHTGCEGL